VSPVSRRTRHRLAALLALAIVIALIAVVVTAHRSSGSGHPRAATVARVPPGPTAEAVRSRRARRAAGPSLAGIPVGRWTAGPSSPQSRGEVSAARIGQQVYVVGGFDAGGHSTALVQRLDLRTGRWSTTTPMPEPLNHMSAVSWNGFLYVVGGYSQPGDTSAGAVSGFWRYDPRSARWSAMPQAPLARAAAGAAVLGDRLYVAGGRSDTQTTISTLEIFDFHTGRWSVGPPLEHAREHVAAVAAGNAVWLLGGRALGAGNFSYVERYRPGARSWQEMAPLPVARSGFQAVDAAGKIIVVGGEGPAGTIAEVDELDPRTGRWTRLPDLPNPRHGLGLIADGPLVYAIEGGPRPGLTTSPVVERLRLRS
jgi:hypothetical protein